MNNKRSKLDKNILLKNFKDFYWLKEELVSFCKENNLKSSGGKIEITNRINHFLETGERIENVKDIVEKSKSNFD